MNFDYFYNRQSEMYNFIRLPMVLMEDEVFESISIEAKVLYSYMLNRMGLSYKNGWIDEDGKVFIYYTMDAIKEQFNCANDKALKIINELDTKSGIGLIEKKRQGLGKPNRIYVKDYGIYKNIFLTDEEYKDLINELGSRVSEYIDRLSSYMKANNRVYQDHKATIINWYLNDQAKSINDKSTRKMNYDIGESLWKT